MKFVTKKLVTFLFVGAVVCQNYKVEDIMFDRFIAGQLFTNKMSYQYIQSIDNPFYEQLLGDYYRDCRWGWYFRFMRDGGGDKKIPTVGFTITF